MRWLAAVAIAALLAAAAAPAVVAQPAALADREFWALIATMSEPGRAFAPSSDYRSDNLISNERSFEDPLPDLAPTGGAFLGVGPEQNFTYIAHLQPPIAFIIDVRRDNLLLHLMYKALFELSNDRAAFVSRLFARRVPALAADVSVEVLMTRVASAPRSSTFASTVADEIVNRLVGTHGFALTMEDQQRIRRLYRVFVREGPAIRWSQQDRRPWMPTYTDLMLARDRTGMHRSYLASADRFDVVRHAEEENRVVPLVGDFGGPKTMRAIADYLRAHRLTVGAFYTSNVEGYLRGTVRDGYEANLAALPLDARSLFIRTRFRTNAPKERKPDFQTSTSVVPMADR